MKNNLYQKIISLKNISNAYLKVVEKFAEEGKSNRYFGFDGITLNSYSFDSLEMIKKVQEELINLQEIRPGLKLTIPKKKKVGFRDVFLHNVIERVKNQAVYQIIALEADNFLSDYLFSYRSSHPHYKAVISVSKRYRKRFNQDWVLVGDISDYTDNMDQELLKEKLERLDFGKEVNEILSLFIKKTYLEKGEKIIDKKGVFPGMPTTVFFYNFYLDEMDKKIGSTCSMYRRVGDDFLIFDTYEKVCEMKKEIEKTLIELRLFKDNHKISIQKASEPFKFLGYSFNNGTIYILTKTVSQIKARIRKRLKYYPVSLEKKIKRLKQIIFKKEPLMIDFVETIYQYNQSNDHLQFKDISDYFFTRIVMFFEGTLNDKNRHKVMSIVKKMGIPSPYMYFVYFHNGRYNIRQLRKLWRK
jgi:hypothetical protein